MSGSRQLVDSAVFVGSGLLLGIEHNCSQIEMAGSGITVAWNREAVQDFVGANRCCIGIAEVIGHDFGNGQECWALVGSSRPVREFRLGTAPARGIKPLVIHADRAWITPEKESPP